MNEVTKPIPLWAGVLGYLLFAVIAFFGLMALLNGEFMVAFLDLGIVGLVVENKLHR